MIMGYADALLASATAVKDSKKATKLDERA